MKSQSSTLTYNWTPIYYSTFIQLHYFDSKSKSYKFGFGIHNYVVDGETGHFLWIPNLVNEGRELGIDMENIIQEKAWTPIKM